MPRKIIALLGYPETGKDVIASHLCHKYGFHRIAFADPIRDQLLAINPMVEIANSTCVLANSTCVRLRALVESVGWREAKSYPDVRELLQRAGGEGNRKVHGEDCWIKIADRKAKECSGDVVITDMRHWDEVQWHQGVELPPYWEGHTQLKTERLRLHVTRPGKGKVNNHKSEQLDYSKHSDAEIANDGSLEELFKKVDTVMSLRFQV